MAIATWVLTCKSWFCMSRMTCLIIFSGSSALSMRSLRLARTKVETRSSNAIKHLLVSSQFSVLGSQFANRATCDALAVAISCPSAACYGDRDVSGDSGGYPDAHVAGRGAHGRAERGSQGDGQAECSCAVNFLVHECLLRFFGRETLPSCARLGRVRDPSPHAYLPSGFGDLSPIWRTLPNRSLSGMPDNVSNNAGICAAMVVMSPVILCMPAALPLPVETMVILSTLASGAARARTISGMLANSLSMTAAWLYSWKASAFTFIALASASPFLKMISASASPWARIDDAWPSASAIRRCFSAAARVSIR